PVVASLVPIHNFLPEGSVLNESHAPVILTAINSIVNEWETLGLYLGIKNKDLKTIYFNSLHQIDICRKDMIVHWLNTGTATREKLIKALEDLERNDVAAEVKRLPKQ
uniref:Death domain-containing protein n=1 Tax=Amphimedon queenslandica TaxID=400682 RepID=A0A1X7SJR6_AMPQE